jgi:hypothetical protein
MGQCRYSSLLIGCGLLAPHPQALHVLLQLWDPEPVSVKRPSVASKPALILERISPMSERLDDFRLARMNLAVHGLEGDIRKAITYCEDRPRTLVKAGAKYYESGGSAIL